VTNCRGNISRVWKQANCVQPVGEYGERLSDTFLRSGMGFGRPMFAGEALDGIDCLGDSTPEHRI